MQYKSAQTLSRFALPAFTLCDYPQKLANLALLLPSVALSVRVQSNTHKTRKKSTSSLARV